MNDDEDKDKIPTSIEDHGPQHAWVWVCENEENDSYSRVIYKDTISSANVVCAVPGCGLIMPGSEYIGVVEKMRQFLHLGEDEHVKRLQDMLEIVALTHEHEPRGDVPYLGDKK